MDTRIKYLDNMNMTEMKTYLNRTEMKKAYFFCVT